MDTVADPLPASVPGTVSVWCGPPDGPPVRSRLADVPHYAASMMKLPLLVALGEEDFRVRVRDSFPSAVGDGTTYTMNRRDDSDPAVWERLGDTVSARWLGRRMITHSSNLAANLLLERLGVEAAAAVWRSVGARHSVTARGIDDRAAREAGLTNLVTAADLAALLRAIAGRPSLLEVLLDQRRTEDLAAGLPAGTRAAHKNGWVRGVRHAGGIVFPADTPPFTLVVCTTTGLSDPASRTLLSRIAASCWRRRTEASRPSSRSR